MKPIRSRKKQRSHPEEVTRSLLRVTVSKDGRGDGVCPSRRRAPRRTPIGLPSWSSYWRHSS